MVEVKVKTKEEKVDEVEKVEEGQEEEKDVEVLKQGIVKVTEELRDLVMREKEIKAGFYAKFYLFGLDDLHKHLFNILENRVKQFKEKGANSVKLRYKDRLVSQIVDFAEERDDVVSIVIEADCDFTEQKRALEEKLKRLLNAYFDLLFDN